MSNVGTVKIIDARGVGSGTTGYRLFSDGVSQLRLIARNGALDTDITLTSLGFAGVEDVDWMTIR